MKPSYYRITLDVREVTSQLVLSMKKGETNRRLIVSLVDGVNPYEIPSDRCYAVFSARKPDGTHVYNDCTIISNKIVYDVTEQTSAAEGRLDCEIILYGDQGKQLIGPRFSIVVYAAVHNEDEIRSSNEYQALANLVAEGSRLMNEFEAGLENIATTEDLDALATKHEEDLDAALTQHTEDLKEYVKEEALADYAPLPTNTIYVAGAYVKDEYGNIKWAGVDAGYGLALLNNGFLTVSTCSKAQIDGRSSKPLSGDQLDYAIISGLTANKTALSDEQKAKVSEWLGIDANAPSVKIGTVTTGAAGTQATVTNSGTAQHAVLNFVIPKGSDGRTGLSGSPGHDGDDYVLTSADKTEIANIVMGLLPTYDGSVTIE